MEFNWEVQHRSRYAANDALEVTVRDGAIALLGATRKRYAVGSRLDILWDEKNKAVGLKANPEGEYTVNKTFEVSCAQFLREHWIALTKTTRYPLLTDAPGVDLYFLAQAPPLSIESAKALIAMPASVVAALEEPAPEAPETREEPQAPEQTPEPPKAAGLPPEPQDNGKAEPAHGSFPAFKAWSAAYAPSQMVQIIACLGADMHKRAVADFVKVKESAVTGVMNNRPDDIAAFKNAPDREEWCRQFLAHQLKRPGALDAETAYHNAVALRMQGPAKRGPVEPPPAPTAEPPKPEPPKREPLPVVDLTKTETPGPWQYPKLKPFQVIGIVLGAVRGLSAVQIAGDPQCEASLNDVHAVLDGEKRRIASLKHDHSDAAIARFRLAVRSEYEDHQARLSKAGAR